MRWAQHALLGMGMALLALASCQGPERFVPPKLHEEYILPPMDDPRFSQPPNYPKDATDKYKLKKDGKDGKDDKTGGPNMGGPRPLSGPGTGGGY